MRRLDRTEYLPILILLVTYDSLRSFCRYHVGSTYLTWGLTFATIACVLWYKKLYFHPDNTKDYRIVQIYFLWLIISIVRGIFAVENYWETKQLIEASSALAVPIFVYVFSIPEITQKTLHLWIRIALPAFAILIFFVDREAYHFYLGPVLLLSCFLPIIPKKWRIVFLGLLVVMMFADWGARSQVIKATIALMISIAYLLSKYIKTALLKVVHWTCYIAPIIVLYLAISGIFNPFQAMTEKADGKYVQESRITGVEGEEDIAADTRTAIYEEVIESAVKNDYVWQGRTPARGNDSWIFGRYSAEELKTGKYERHANEICHTNVFTWLGLIGVILYGLIYLKSSYLSVYKSNNIWMKLLGLYTAFRWAYGWVEDFNMFDIMNISLWMMIAMGFSEKFRQMDDQQFKEWVQKIFEK